MIDPRFANTGANPLAPGFGQQQVPFQPHYRHRHRKNKHRGGAESPLSRDESIHKVGHAHHHQHHQQQYNEGVPFGGGYGVPYGGAGFGAGVGGGYQQQQFGYAGQQQINPYGQNQFGGDASGAVAKHHRRHHHRRHHRHQGAEGSASADFHAHAVPEQLIGQRSSSVLGENARQSRSPGLPIDGALDAAGADQVVHRRHRHHRHHHHSAGQGGHGHAHSHSHSHAHHSHSHTGADGYGHINDDLIFIERSDHSPHRQSPPPGYEYKGKIEVQGAHQVFRSRSRGQEGIAPPILPQPIPPSVGYNPCPPCYQQMVLTSGPMGPCPPGVPCPPGGTLYHGQLVSSGPVGHAGIGGFGGVAGGVGFGGAGPIGSAGVGGLSNLAASLPFPAQGQLVADYIVESAAGIGSSDGVVIGTTSQYQGSGTGFEEKFRHHETEQHVIGRPTIIEVWQKRKHEECEKKRSRSRSRSPIPIGPSFDFDRFRNEILAAIERINQGKIPLPIQPVKWNGHDGGTQTDIHGNEVIYRPPAERPVAPIIQQAGEVRVIVQPIQPVFYMPRQGPTQPPVAPIAPVPPAPSAAPHVVYVPRNVYVPVIKPVFVPRERVIVRPQIIHVARPVLVDRPVPVTQRPIIIDRERPIPVPVRGPAPAAAAQSGGSKVVREEFVYRDNLPVAYGGRCAEFAGGVNYGYVPAQQQQNQYAASSLHEATAYRAQPAPQTVFDMHLPNQYQQSHSASHLHMQQPGGGSAHGSYSNLARTNSASAINVGHRNQEVIRQTFSQSAQAAGIPVDCPTQVEVLDTSVNPFWQKTDQPTLMRRYGRPAYEIIHKTDQVEQQMYNELRQRSSSGGAQRSDSAASYGSSSGGLVGGGGLRASGGSFSSIPLGDIQNLNPEGIPHQGPAPIPVRINY